MTRHTQSTLGLALLFALVIPASASAQAFGGGISVWVPLDLMQGQEGSISFETSMETSIGLGELLSFPIGFAYNQVYGISPSGTLANGTELQSGGPWWYSDSFVPYLMAQLRLPLGPVYFEVFGGGALNLTPGLRPLHDQMARDLNAAGAFGGTTIAGNVAVTDLTVENGVGYGFVAGGAAGLTFGQISVNLNATYRHILQPVTVKGTYFSTTGQAAFNTTADDYVRDLTALMQGFAFGIGGSFAM